MKEKPEIPKFPDIETKVHIFGVDVTPEQYVEFKRECKLDALIAALTIIAVIIGSFIYWIYREPTR